VSFPDWSSTAGAPAPFDFVVPLSAPWQFTGNRALLIDVLVVNNSSTGLVNVDRTFVAGVNVQGTDLGGGCAPTGQIAPLQHALQLESGGPGQTRVGQRLRVVLNSGIPTQLVFLLLDFTVSDIALPGLCTNLRAVPTITVPLTSTNANGALAPCTLAFPFSPNLVGLPIVTQLAQFDTLRPAGLPLVLSNGCTGQLPGGGASQVDCAWMVGVGNRPEVGNVFWGGGMIIALL
jgi:hypothetical protein